ncbi:N-formylglutamate amidohydrolase [Streptomyces griseoviridis]|uniref:N-formylglutamate amidohydrolase n=1 Tax=Streptomyces griseoviridis TaxID=45398 RepID=A0A3S9Z7E8_STRGD|nr:N-formylglutamate amidohydrolase [Streptomyces griseoviridis]AZS83640.1 N-formylglutamate amidohydrolase [Streptomyces griseoviridis]QCN89505.1 N-formylglutamate amidohydrolase [Streptomyces griseoviridis]
MPSAAPPFALLPGAAGSPVVLHVPHGARAVPAEVRAGILLDDAALERELDHLTDAHTAELAEAAAARSAVTPWRFVNGLSRLVVDPERFPDEREEMRAVGMGAVYTRTAHREPLRAEDTDPEPLLARWFRPYAAAMAEAVADRLAATERAVIVDVHSYPSRALPYELHGTGPRPPVCLGTDAFHTPPALLAAAREAFAGCGGTGVDSPFGGTYVPLAFHRSDPRVSALMVEIRRDTYMTEPGGPAGAGLERLAAALSALVDAVSR